MVTFEKHPPGRTTEPVIVMAPEQTDEPAKHSYEGA